MSELARQETALDVFGRPRDQQYFEAIAIAVSLMHDALETYGRRLDGLADAWEMGLRARGIRIEEIPLATAAFVGGLGGAKFPTPGQFADWIINQRHWSLTQSELKAIGDKARQESDARAEAFRKKMIARYGNCSRETVARHLDQLTPKLMQRVRISSRPASPTIPPEVHEELREKATQRGDGSEFFK